MTIEIVHARVNSESVTALRRWVTPADIDAGRRFRRQLDGERLVVRRGLARVAVADWLAVDPARVVVARRCAVCHSATHGAPVVSRPAGTAVAVSVSSSGDRAIVAVSEQRRIGVDIETWTRGRTVDFVSLPVFNDAERALLRADDESDRRHGHELWVRKEAVGKCIGVGLTDAADRYNCTRPAQDWVMATDEQSPIAYLDLHIAPDVAGAVATDHPTSMQVREFVSGGPGGQPEFRSATGLSAGPKP